MFCFSYILLFFKSWCKKFAALHNNFTAEIIKIIHKINMYFLEKNTIKTKKLCFTTFWGRTAVSTELLLSVLRVVEENFIKISMNLYAKVRKGPTLKHIVMRSSSSSLLGKMMANAGTNAHLICPGVDNDTLMSTRNFVHTNYCN